MTKKEVFKNLIFSHKIYIFPTLFGCSKTRIDVAENIWSCFHFIGHNSKLKKVLNQIGIIFDQHPKISKKQVLYFIHQL